MIFAKLTGGLGNQLFQYAVAKWIKQVTGQNICLDYSDYGSYELNHNATFNNTLNRLNIEYDKVIFEKSEFQSLCSNHKEYKKMYNRLKRIARIIQFEGRIGLERYLQPKLNRQGLVFARDGYVPIYPEIIKSKDVVVSGFFQSTKYFPELRNELIKDFQLKEDISEDNKQWIHQFENSQSVCFHIRRGDYAVENRAHCTLSYYRRAMVEIEKRVSNPHFFVFSDDLEWVKNNIDFGSRNITYVNSNNDSCNELNIMKHCKHFVLSNSTFSWWAQYLSESEKKVVIAPRPWLRRIPSDIYMENWVTLSVYE